MNFANADMVGHSGKMEPTVRAVEAVDACLGRIYQALRARNGALDHHRRSRQRRDDDRSGHARPAHVSHHQSRAVHSGDDDPRAKLRAGGALQDIAPTLLGVLGESQPKEMTGRDLRVT